MAGCDTCIVVPPLVVSGRDSGKKIDSITAAKARRDSLARDSSANEVARLDSLARVKERSVRVPRGNVETAEHRDSLRAAKEARAARAAAMRDSLNNARKVSTAKAAALKESVLEARKESDSKAREGRERAKVLSQGKDITPPPPTAQTPVTDGSLPVQPTGPRTILINSTPAGANYRLTLKTNPSQIYEGVTPKNIKLPVGEYVWEMSKAGYTPNRSKQSLFVQAAGQETLEVTLVPAEVGTALADGEDHVKRGDCTAAINVYSGIPRPADLSGSVGERWLSGRLSLAQCYRDKKSYDKAIETLQALIVDRPAQWGPRYQLGTIQCELQVKDFSSGKKTFRELTSYLGNVASQRKQSVQALADYGAALCLSHEYDAKPNKRGWEMLRDQASTQYETFLIGARVLLQKGVPPDLKAELQRAAEESEAKLKSLQGNS